MKEEKKPIDVKDASINDILGPTVIKFQKQTIERQEYYITYLNDALAKSYKVSKRLSRILLIVSIFFLIKSLYDFWWLISKCF